MPSIVITGSAGGIGGGIAKAFFDQGYQVVISDLHEDALAQRVQAIAGSAQHERLLAVSCDVTEEASIQNLWDQAAQRFGQIDVWINNAGLGGTQNIIVNSNTAQLMAIVDVNIKGVILGTHVAYNGMQRQNQGHIYNMVGFGVNGMTRPKMIMYGTSKCAVGYFSKGVAQEIADSNIKLGWINPGMVISPMVIANAKKMSAEDWKSGRPLFNIFGRSPELVGELLQQHIVADNKNGHYINLLSPSRMLSQFLRWLPKREDRLKTYGI